MTKQKGVEIKLSFLTGRLLLGVELWCIIIHEGGRSSIYTGDDK
jgi:hypothetical protein